jgi:hypothetical protein
MTQTIMTQTTGSVTVVIPATSRLAAASLKMPISGSALFLGCCDFPMMDRDQQTYL